MKQDWHPDELARYWTLSPEERELLCNKTGATRLSFAVLLKSFQFEGRFPDHREDIAGSMVAHLAGQTSVPPDAYFDGEWSERTQRHQRAEVREHCGFRMFHAEDEAAFIAWLRERVTSPNPEAEAFKITVYDYLRSQHLEPPATERFRRLLRLAVNGILAGEIRRIAAGLPRGRDLREAVDQVFGEAVAEIFGVGIGPHVNKRHHCKGVDRFGPRS